MGRSTEGDVRKAVALHRAGELLKAQQVYQRVLAGNPNHAVALHFLGVLDHQTGHSDRAITRIERAISVAPGYADAWNNLGNILKETNQLEAAARAYRRVVDLMPEHADAWNNLGVVLRGQSRHDEAERAYARAIEIDPGHAAAWQNRGNLFARTSRPDDAIAAYRRVLELRPRDATAYDALTTTLYRSGRVDEAIAVYHEWLQADPSSSVANHMLAACTGEAAPTRASDDYVRDTFDAFAGSFDRVLDQLGYRAPQLIAGQLDRVLSQDGSLLAIADVGCGTGLCADFLRRRAARLVGVDLSPGMLARARSRQQYDQLAEAELTTWLASQTPTYDLLVSADTLCYIGALEATMSAAWGALRPGGLFVFTLERADDDVTAYRLNPSGRYSHAERYVERSAAGANFELLELEHVVLRRENAQDVGGLLVSVRRPAPLAR